MRVAPSARSWSIRSCCCAACAETTGAERKAPTTPRARATSRTPVAAALARRARDRDCTTEITENTEGREEETGGDEMGGASAGAAGDSRLLVAVKCRRRDARD